MLSTLRKEDCGCGGGKTNCITRNVMKKWVNEELKRLDCGCGCKGTSKFIKKYGLVGGKILADCKPGWRQDALTCVSECNPDERDDGLSCRAKCKPGQIDDGLTCRNPIQSSMNQCPPGSKDIWGTCWGPTTKWCVDDCFNHPSCKSWWCGRLKGLFGEDWGPKLCTHCEARCGQTCWWTDGITKQLHERELKIWGGEIYFQQIRFKTIEGRVNFVELGQAIKSGVEDLFSEDGPLARAFDPEKNGVGAAFRKFGDDMKNILEDVGARIKKGFEDFGAAAKKAFEDFGSLVADKFIAFGEGFVAMMKDPMFWAEVVGVLAVIGSTALAMAGTALTAGMGAPAFAALVAASAMAGPAAKMIVKASRGEPIDGLDIANLLISGASAMIPGMDGTVKLLMQAGTTAASLVVTGVQVAQAFGAVPSTCIANCPAPPTVDVPGIPPQPPQDPPPAGQKSDAEILALVPPNAFNRVLKNPRRPNPDWIGMSEADYIAKYRKDTYENATVGPGGELVDPEDNIIEDAIDVVPDAPPIYIDDAKTPNPIGEGMEEFPGFEPMPGDEIDEFPGFEPMPGDGMDEFPGFEPMPPLEGGADPLLRVVDKGPYLSSFWGSDQDKARENIPKTDAGLDFNPTCYIQNNPEISASVNNDPNIMTTHWVEIGSKNRGEFHADCGGKEQVERLKLERIREEERIAGMRNVCKAADRFWDEKAKKCDGHRHADGKFNTDAEECTRNHSFWDHAGNKSWCDRFRDKDGKRQTDEDRCHALNNRWNGRECNELFNIDGSRKTIEDFCDGLNGHWTGTICDLEKDRNGDPHVEKELCESGNNRWVNEQCERVQWWSGSYRKLKFDADGFPLSGVGTIIANVDGFIPMAGPSGEIEYAIVNAAGDKKPKYMIKCTPTNETRCEGLKDVEGKVKDWREFCFENFNGNPLNNGICSPEAKLPILPTSTKMLKAKYNKLEKTFKDRDAREKAAKEQIDKETRDLIDHYKRTGQLLPPGLDAVPSTPAPAPTPVEDAPIGFPGLGFGKPKSLTLYYAEWCHFCKVLMPIWKKLGSEYKGIKIVAVEEQQNTSFPVDGYPTIVYRDGSRMEKYEGQRTKAGIVNFLKSKL